MQNEKLQQAANDVYAAARKTKKAGDVVLRPSRIVTADDTAAHNAAIDEELRAKRIFLTLDPCAEDMEEIRAELSVIFSGGAE